MSSYITFYYCYWKYIFIQECQECRHPHLRPYLPTFLPLKFGHQKDHHLHRQVGKLANFARGEQELVGHMRIELSFLLCKYLARDGCCLEFMPTGPRYLEGYINSNKIWHLHSLSTGPGLGLIMYILTTLELPTHYFNFHLFRRRTCGPRMFQSAFKWKGVDIYFEEWTGKKGHIWNI